MVTETKNTAATQDVVCDPNANLVKNQPLLKGWRIFLPYLFAFLYNALLIGLVAGLVFLPMIAPESLFDPANMWAMGEQSFEGLNSLFNIVMPMVESILGDPTNALSMTTQLFPLAIMAIIMVYAAIWFGVRFISSFFALLTCGLRKKRIIDQFYFKNNHQYYRLGNLDHDWGIVGTICLTCLVFVLYNANLFLKGFGLMPHGIGMLEFISNYQFLNFGNVIFLAGLVGLIVMKILRKIFTFGLSRKVKKTYIKARK